MLDAFFYINYGGEGLRLAMHCYDQTVEQAALLRPVEGCALVIVPANTIRDRADSLFTPISEPIPANRPAISGISTD